MTKGEASLSHFITENSSFLSVIGVFAAIATYFQSKIDTSVLFSFSSENRAYIMASFFSYAIFILLSCVLVKNIVILKDKTASLKIFNLLFVAFLCSVIFLVLDVHKIFSTTNLHVFILFIFGATLDCIYIYIHGKLIEPSAKYKNLPYLTKRIVYIVGLIVFFLFAYYLSKPIADIMLGSLT